ncbi:Hyaluronan and proteoglycan link protein 1, partial [Coelomomyces lativittatus]
MSNKSLPHQTVPNLTLSPNATRVAKEETKIDPLDELAGLRRKLLGENEIRAEINGVLTFRIVKMILLELERGPVLKQSCYCSISVVNLTKNTHVASKDAGCVTWNQTKHFSVQIPVNRRHPFNLVKLQFFEVPSANPSCARRIGLVSLHLHDIISASPVSGIFEVWDENHLIGDVALEITFNYGVFGYGYATQLKEEKRSTDEMIMYSLFPRINPGEDQLDPDTGVLNIQSTPHPSYIPFKEKVYLSYGKEL